MKIHVGVRFYIPQDSQWSQEEWEWFLVNTIKDAVFMRDGRIDAPTVYQIRED